MRKIDILAIAASTLLSLVCIADQLSFAHVLPNAYALWTFALGLLPVPLFLFLMATPGVWRWLVSKV